MQSSSCSGKWSLPVMLIVDLSLTTVVQHSPLTALCLAYTRTRVSLRSMVQFGRMRMRMTTITLRVQNFNSLLTEMITPQTYIQVYIHIKPLPVPRVFGARSGSPRIMSCYYCMHVVSILFLYRELSFRIN